MKTPELSSGKDARQSTRRTKSVNCSSLYQRSPIPSTVSRILAPNSMKLPKPAICQPLRPPLPSDRNPGSTGNVFLTIADAVFRDRDNAVRDGLAEPSAGNTPGPATYAFATL